MLWLYLRVPMVMYGICGMKTMALAGGAAWLYSYLRVPMVIGHVRSLWYEDHVPGWWPPDYTRTWGCRWSCTVSVVWRPWPWRVAAWRPPGTPATARTGCGRGRTSRTHSDRIWAHVDQASPNSVQRRHSVGQEYTFVSEAHNLPAAGQYCMGCWKRVRLTVNVFTATCTVMSRHK